MSSDQPGGQYPGSPAPGQPPTSQPPFTQTPPPPPQYGYSTSPPPYYGQPSVGYQPYGAPVARPSNSSALAGLILGIAGLCVAWIPLLGIVAWLVNGLGMLFSVLAFRRNDPETRTMSLVGMVLNGLALLVCVGWVALFLISFASGAVQGS